MAFGNPTEAQGIPVPDMILHADPNNSGQGWVGDQLDNPIHGDGTLAVPDWRTDFVKWAFEHTGPKAAPTTYGRVLLMKAGRYAPFSFDPTSSGTYRINFIDSSVATPVVVRGEPGTIIGPQLTPGSALMQVIGRTATHTYNSLHWYGVTWEGAPASASIKIGECEDLLDSPITTYKDWRFIDCEIDGLFDHKSGLSSNSLVNSKWGLCSWSLEDFEWIGGTVHDIEEEHAFYIRSSQGDVTISDVTIWEVGRTAVQVVARVSDSCGTGLPTNPGNLTITDNTIIDIGLQRGSPQPGQTGDYHAGTAITITGGQGGVVTIKRNHVEFGFDTMTPGLKQAIVSRSDYPVGKPFGTGAIVIWSTADKDVEPSGEIRVCANVRASNNTVLFAPDSGDRVAIQLANITVLRTVDNLITMGANANAIWLGDVNNPTDIQYTLMLQNIFPNRDLLACLANRSRCSDEPLEVTSGDVWPKSTLLVPDGQTAPLVASRGRLTGRGFATLGYTVPVSYCINDNVVSPGTSIIAIADGTCNPCTQPQGFCFVEPGQ